MDCKAWLGKCQNYKNFSVKHPVLTMLPASSFPVADRKWDNNSVNCSHIISHLIVRATARLEYANEPAKWICAFWKVNFKRSVVTGSQQGLVPNVFYDLIMKVNGTPLSSQSTSDHLTLRWLFLATKMTSLQSSFTPLWDHIQTAGRFFVKVKCTSSAPSPGTVQEASSLISVVKQLTVIACSVLLPSKWEQGPKEQ